MTGAGFASDADDRIDEVRRAVLRVLRRARVAVPRDAIEITPSEYASTAPAFAVRAGEMLLHCKQGNEAHASYGHRAGSRHEALVYERVLPAAQLPGPRWYGSWREPKSRRLWLVMEHIRNADQLERSTGAQMSAAAAWIGAFHARTAPVSAPFLIRYSRDYFRSWLTRACELMDSVPAWLVDLERKSANFADILLDAPASAIHGEYYPLNILAADHLVYPIDWESAAWGAGEIDLAALTDDWDEETVRECEGAYCAARWPAGAPAGFARILSAARLYWHSRWLGERAEWSNHPNTLWRREALRREAENLGVLSQGSNEEP